MIRLGWRGKLNLGGPRITALKVDCGRLYAVQEDGKAWRIVGVWPEIWLAVRSRWRGGL